VVSQTFSELSIELTVGEIARQCGYSDRKPLPGRVERAIAESLAEAASELKPRGTYSLYSVTARSERTLSLGGVTIQGQVGRFLAGTTRVAAFLVTAGSELTELRERRPRTSDPLRDWVLDAIGSWAAEAAAEALMLRLAAELGPDEALTLRYSPGYCGMDLQEQRAIFELVQAESIGVSLLASCLMQPIKSISGLVGLGPRSAIVAERSPCDRCPELGCHMRR
jgi:hypothetical protein